MNERSCANHQRRGRRIRRWEYVLEPDKPADVGVAIAVELSVGNGVCLVESELGQRHTRKADTESFQRRPAGDGLGQTLCEFIEFVIHNFSFVLGFAFTYLLMDAQWPPLQTD